MDYLLSWADHTLALASAPAWLLHLEVVEVTSPNGPIGSTAVMRARGRGLQDEVWNDLVRGRAGSRGGTPQWLFSAESRAQPASARSRWEEA